MYNSMPETMQILKSEISDLLTSTDIIYPVGPQFNLKKPHSAEKTRATE